ncbi:uncharacterized protein EI90DRAFT_775356 [Cantharellus anzutake]|uniref:uncharacterized protein n=1 Tax=Cantharellus anzutake TaxID=1750568 RepID=UPI001903A5D6|nr:uncharacterized protein EI90DRAFT_775356 [Cantharellus anzutake]KAF8342683.1 hypothetical protein EI90DRAFT_775356 [Cantharellus anzutake]
MALVLVVVLATVRIEIVEVRLAGRVYVVVASRDVEVMISGNAKVCLFVHVQLLQSFVRAAKAWAISVESQFSRVQTPALVKKVLLYYVRAVEGLLTKMTRGTLAHLLQTHCRIRATGG